jgi:hypothetical protein
LFTKGDISGRLPEVPVILFVGGIRVASFPDDSLSAVPWPDRRRRAGGAGHWSRRAPFANAYAKAYAFAANGNSLQSRRLHRSLPNEQSGTGRQGDLHAELHDADADPQEKRGMQVIAR